MTNSKLLNVVDLKTDLNIGELGDRFCDYFGHHYIGDVISEIADSNIDVYTYDLLKWLPDNYEWVEEAISQGLCNMSEPDIPRMIMAGQYEKYSSELYECLDEIMFNYCLNYILNDLKIETLTNEQLEELQEKCTDVDNNDTLDMFEDFINELLNVEEEE